MSERRIGKEDDYFTSRRSPAVGAGMATEDLGATEVRWGAGNILRSGMAPYFDALWCHMEARRWSTPYWGVSWWRRGASGRRGNCFLFLGREKTDGNHRRAVAVDQELSRCFAHFPS